MLFGKRGKSGLVALNLDVAGVAAFVKERLGKEVIFLLCPPNFRTVFSHFFFINFS
jgi:succinyl-CoA synthetase beta subunit